MSKVFSKTLFLLILTSLLWNFLSFSSLLLAADEKGEKIEAKCEPPKCICDSYAAKIQCSYRAMFSAGGFATVASPKEERNLLAQRIGLIIQGFLGLVGMVFLLIVVYSGIQWMLAQGNEEEVRQAKERITQAAIGLFIVLAAWAIVFTISNLLFKPSAPSGIIQWSVY